MYMKKREKMLSFVWERGILKQQNQVTWMRSYVLKDVSVINPVASSRDFLVQQDIEGYFVQVQWPDSNVMKYQECYSVNIEIQKLREILT